MRRIYYHCLLIGFAVAHSLAFAALPPSRDPARTALFEFKDGDIVALLGDTLIEREQSYGYLETRLTEAFPTKNIIFRNLGWSADTVLGESRASFDPPEKGFDRLKEHLTAVKPSVVILGYGMASSFAGESGLAKFRTDINKLIDTILQISKDVRFVILSPIRHENIGGALPDPSQHNRNLELYSHSLSDIAAERHFTFIPLDRLLSDRGRGGDIHPVTDNGIHLSDYGYFRMAESAENYFAGNSSVWRLGIKVDGQLRDGSTLHVSNLERTDGQIRFAGQVGALPLPLPTEIKQPRVASMLQIAGLKPGHYTLKINSQAVATHSDVEWSKGQPIQKNPLYEQAEKLRQVIIKKNQLYFYRWRPQNETYLFGFRKYEQGQNAREIPMFDPLVSALEREIASLRQAPPLTFELSAATPEDQSNPQPAKPKPSSAAMALPPPSHIQPRPDFEIAPGFEIELFAESPQLAKPIQMNFDPQGRLWIASSSVYPQIQPGQKADDKIIVIEDTDGDGKADRSTVFAEGLLIPTGIEPGDGGVYVGQGTELLHLKDTDGDGRADQKRIVLSGFGTEDTHHILHTLRWGHDGQLYLNQSIYIHSHLETPHGVVRLNSGGILNLRPDTMEVGIHMRGLVNSWGHQFDRFGQSFVTDGAGGEGINYVVPGAMYVTYAGARRILGSVSPGSYPKFASLEIIESEHFPGDFQGNMITCDFRAHRVVRFAISEEGSGYVTKEMPDLIRTTNVTFRPIDVKLGPDGALYIADWSNPIIQHGEVDFRDPRRDHENGRIWRVTAKNRPLVPRPKLQEMNVTQLLDQFLSPNAYARQQARRVLTERSTNIVSDLAAWTQAHPADQAQMQALWMYQSINVINQDLLEKVLGAQDGRVRAAGVRVVSFWHNRLANPIALLARAVNDDFPRVRLEAVRALSRIPSTESAGLVLNALEKPMDRFLDYAIWLSINDLAQPWVDAIASGAWKIAGQEKQLEFGLKAILPELASKVLAQLWDNGNIPRDGTGPWFELIGQAGSANELRHLFDLLQEKQLSDATRLRAINALEEAARVRHISPGGNLETIGDLFNSQDGKFRPRAAQLIGYWKLQKFAPDLLKTADAKENSPELRQALFQALRSLGGANVIEGLAALTVPDRDLTVRQQAAQALMNLDMNRALPLAVAVLNATGTEKEALALWRSLLSIKGAAPALARALPKDGLPPVMAKTGLRAAREGGRNEPELVLALSRSVEMDKETVTLTPSELQDLVTKISTKGDPARGELIYRKAEQACLTCHSIGGVGGKVGPDLTSIGASAPIDYLIESILFPNRKIKEGFNSTIVETKDGQEFSGVIARETPEQLFLHDVTDKEIPIPKSNIQKRTNGGSLMPSGLIDNLTPSEQIDLYRFLSELGKPGAYDASRNNVARLWRLCPATIDLSQFGDDRVLQLGLTNAIWETAPALVDGSLLGSALQTRLNAMKYRDPSAIYAATQFELSKPGSARFQIESSPDVQIWIDSKSVPNHPEFSLDLAAGIHTVILKANAKNLPHLIRLRSNDTTFLTK